MPRKSGKPSRSKQASELFAEQLLERGLPDAEREYPFAESLGRRWRFDFAWPDAKVAVEIEGLVVMRIDGRLVCLGRHASITGFKEDAVKYGWAAVLGWRVVRFEQSQVKDRTAIDMVTRLLSGVAPTKQTACASQRDRSRGAGTTRTLDFGPEF